MSEIKLDANKEIGWHVLPGELRALSCGDYDGKDMPLGLPTALRYLAAAIEEQVKPAIEEPQEFGSIVRAKALAAEYLWQRSPMHGKHYWESETGAVEVWPELTDVEVLRVGLEEIPSESQKAAQDDAYSRGYEEGVQSNLASPVDRSNINSALREAMAKISLREARLIVERDSYELADAVMKELAP